MILSRFLEKTRIRVIPAQAGIHLDFCTSNLDPGLRRDDEQEADTADPLRLLIDARIGTLTQQFRFTRVAGQRCRAFEFRARLVVAAQLEQQVTAYARQQVVTGQRTFLLQRIHQLQSASGPSAIDTATARFNSTIGDGATAARRAYSDAIRAQSVSCACNARTWQAAIAACSA